MRLFFFSLLILPSLLFSQNENNCDGIKNAKATGYCLEYYNSNLKKCSKEKAVFKQYKYFFKGKRHMSLPIYWSGKNYNIYQGERMIQKTDSIELLNGIYTVKDGKGRLSYTYLFEKGYCKKAIMWSKQSKSQGGAPTVNVICEYDYSTIPFNVHLVEFKEGKLFYNGYHYTRNNSWIEILTKDVISENILEFNGVPPKK